MNPTFESTIQRLRARRNDREQRRALKNELASYSSQHDLLDFETMLDRYPDEHTVELRQMLSRQTSQSV